MSKERLIVFTRFPEFGKVKSRLAATLGDEVALQIHDQLARRTVAEGRAWGGELELRATGGNEAEWIAWLGEARWVDQGEGGLGERLSRAMQSAFADGVERVVIIGTDCPALDRGRIEEAFIRLRDVRVVFGPAHDGGYYLIGMAEARAELFEGIDWGTDQVLRQSLEKAQGAAVLETLTDLDVEADLEFCREESGWCLDAQAPKFES